MEHEHKLILCMPLEPLGVRYGKGLEGSAFGRRWSYPADALAENECRLSNECFSEAGPDKTKMHTKHTSDTIGHALLVVVLR